MTSLSKTKKKNSLGYTYTLWVLSKINLEMYKESIAYSYELLNIYFRVGVSNSLSLWIT